MKRMRYWFPTLMDMVNTTVTFSSYVVIRTYSNCHMNYIKLPIEEIAKMFPSVSIVNWACTGECRVDLTNVNIAVKGCLLGNFLFVCLLLKPFTTYLYCNQSYLTLVSVPFLHRVRCLQSIFVYLKGEYCISLVIVEESNRRISARDRYSVTIKALKPMRVFLD